MIAELINPMVRGWLNYFMSYCKSAVKYTMKCLNDRLCRWSMRKYKRFRGHKMRAKEWLGELAKREPNLVTAQQPPHHPKRKPSANTEGLIMHDSYSSVNGAGLVLFAMESLISLLHGMKLSSSSFENGLPMYCISVKMRLR